MYISALDDQSDKWCIGRVYRKEFKGKIKIYPNV
jgi:hypothetical protein